MGYADAAAWTAKRATERRALLLWIQDRINMNKFGCLTFQAGLLNFYRLLQLEAERTF